MIYNIHICKHSAGCQAAIGMNAHALLKSSCLRFLIHRQYLNICRGSEDSDPQEGFRVPRFYSELSQHVHESLDAWSMYYIHYWNINMQGLQIHTSSFTQRHPPFWSCYMIFFSTTHACVQLHHSKWVIKKEWSSMINPNCDPSVVGQCLLCMQSPIWSLARRADLYSGGGSVSFCYRQCSAHVFVPCISWRLLAMSIPTTNSPTDVLRWQMNALCLHGNLACLTFTTCTWDPVR